MQAITLSVLAVLGIAAQAQNAGEYRVSGPYTHDNLSIFLIHGAGAPTKKLLTLQEAIAQHKVVVYETRNVNELSIENVSDQDVFIESGDIVKGGAQDRTLKDDIILPTKSGKINITSFCVEHGRWTRRGEEPVNTFGSATETVATKDIKMAVRVEADQSQVWNKVAKAQDRLSGVAGASVRSAASPSSFAMTMVAPVVQKSIDGYIKELAGIIDNRSDVIGYAFAINGKVNSADVYASHDLFARLWPKLLRSSAVEAVSEYDSSKKFQPANADAVRAAIRDAESGQASSKNLTDRTGVVVKQTTQNIMFETRDRAQRDAWVHRNYMTK
jgi:hypothetical protein